MGRRSLRVTLTRIHLPSRVLLEQSDVVASMLTLDFGRVENLFADESLEKLYLNDGGKLAVLTDHVKKVFKQGQFKHTKTYFSSSACNNNSRAYS